jgi:hypothetical protein
VGRLVIMLFNDQAQARQLGVDQHWLSRFGRRGVDLSVSSVLTSTGSHVLVDAAWTYWSARC